MNAALQIVLLSSLYCVPVLIPLASTSHYNEMQNRKDANFTSTNFDNLGMGNIEVRNQQSLWNGENLSFLRADFEPTMYRSRSCEYGTLNSLHMLKVLEE